MKIELEDDSMTIIIFKDPSYGLTNGFGNQYNILIPEGYGLNLWRRFIYSGCKFIGLSEYESLTLE